MVIKLTKTVFCRTVVYYLKKRSIIYNNNNNNIYKINIIYIKKLYNII